MIRAISSVCWSGPPNLLILNQKRKSKYTVVQGPEAFRSGSLGSHVVAVNPVELAHQKSRRNPAGQGQPPVRRPACGSGLQMVLPRVPTRGRDNFVRPFLSQGLVVSQVVPFCRHPRECPCIFKRKVGTLSQKREGRMGSIAYERSAFPDPGFGNRMAKQSPKSDFINRIDEVANRPSEICECRPQVGRVVTVRPAFFGPCAAFLNGHQVHQLTSAQRIAYNMTPRTHGHRSFRGVCCRGHNGTPGDLSREYRFSRTIDCCAPYRVKTVSTNDQFRP